MHHTYTAHELARAAGYTIRPMTTPGVREVDTGFGLILEVGPCANDLEIVRFARRHLVIPVSCRETLVGTSKAV
jgi:hypothetical protein